MVCEDIWKDTKDIKVSLQQQFNQELAKKSIVI